MPVKSKLAHDRDVYLVTEGRELWAQPWAANGVFAMNRIERAWLDGIRYREANPPPPQFKRANPGWLKGKLQP